jgi:hypothetical protein
VGGKPEAHPCTGNTNHVEGAAIWVSLLKKAKPVAVDRVVT